MDFKNERLMMSKEEVINRAKELFNENQEVLITKYMFLEQQVKKQKEVIDKAVEYVKNNLIVSSILDGKKYYCLNNYGFNYKELLEILEDKEA